jgi:hypothetical protein
MLSSMFTKLLFGVAFFLPVLTLAGQYPDEAKSTRTTVTVHVVWLPSFEAVHAVCTFQMAERGVVGCYDPSTQTIYAVEPRNFNDNFLLEILGHEFWHALGAEHPAL